MVKEPVWGAKELFRIIITSKIKVWHILKSQNEEMMKESVRWAKVISNSYNFNNKTMMYIKLPKLRNAKERVWGATELVRTIITSVVKHDIY